MEHIMNQVKLRGTLFCPPEFSHENHGISFYRFMVEVPRLSGTSDFLPVIAAESVLEEMDLAGGYQIYVQGQMRSFHDNGTKGPRLRIFVFADQVEAVDDEPCNEVLLRGTVQKDPIYRKTPLGREICDVMIAVERSYGRTDVIPCIFWGRAARTVCELCAGQEVGLEGRFQSREYRKVTEEGTEIRTAYEVSALNLQL